MNIIIRPGKIEDLEQIQKLSQLLLLKNKMNMTTSMIQIGHLLKKEKSISQKG